MSSNMSVSVPSKIVIVGTSSMTLHQRFSKIEQTRPAQQKVTVRPQTLGFRKAKLVPKYRGIDEEEEEDFMDVAEMPEEQDVPTAFLHRTSLPVIRRKRPPVFRPIPLTQLPIDERISFPPQRLYAPVQRMNNFRSRGFSPRGTFNRFGGPFNNGFRSQNAFSPVKNRPQMSNGFSRFGSPRFRAGLNRRGTFRKQQQMKRTPEQLDRELDEYMKKPASSKHRPITI